MATGTERMPACIFDEMAGVRDITPPQSQISSDNVNVKQRFSEPDEKRLSDAAAITLAAAPNFGEYLKKLAKQLLDIKDEDDEAPIKKEVNPLKKFDITIVIKFAKSIGEKTCDILTRLKEWFEEKIKDFFIEIVQNVISIAWKVLKWALDLMWTVAKFILKILWKVVKAAFKILVKVMKFIMKMLGKLIRWIWKGVVALAKAFWRLMKRLFIKKKNPKPEVFMMSEPKGLIPSDPTISPPPPPAMQTEMDIVEKEGKAEIKISKLTKFKMAWAKANKIRKSFTFKGMKQQVESIIWKAIKKLLKILWNLIRKLVRRIFGKIIDKLIDTVVKIIVRFIVMQIIGSAIPGLGNAFALAMTAINAIMLIANAVMFIQGLVQTMEDISQSMSGGNNDNDDDNDSDDNDDEENKIKKVKKSSPYDYRRKLEELSANGQENTREYLLYKRLYMTELLKQAQSTNNHNEIKILREAMGIKTNSNGIESEPDPEALKKIDLVALTKKMEDEAKKQYYFNKEKNKEDIINSNELEELLKAADGEPEWAVIWKRVVQYMFDEIEKRYKNKDRYIKAVYDANQLEPFKIEVNHEIPREPWEKLYRERKNNKIDYLLKQAVKKSEDNQTGSLLGADWTFGNAMRGILDGRFREIAGLIELIKKHKINFMDETEEYRVSLHNVNIQQRRKTNIWVDIMTLLAVRKAVRSK
jgi:hypothetical protein